MLRCVIFYSSLATMTLFFYSFFSFYHLPLFSFHYFVIFIFTYFPFSPLTFYLSYMPLPLLFLFLLSLRLFLPFFPLFCTFSFVSFMLFSPSPFFLTSFSHHSLNCCKSSFYSPSFHLLFRSFSSIPSSPLPSSPILCPFTVPFSSLHY